MSTRYQSKTSKGIRLPFWLGAVLFLGIAIFFLWNEHRAHLLGALPWLLLLACPLLHLFMHGGHGHGSHPSGRAPQESGGANASKETSS